MTQQYAELLEKLKKQEEELQFDSFTNDDAIAVGLKIMETAKKENLPVTIDVIRSGQQMFHAALTGTAPDNDEWIRRKVKLVNRMQRSSFRINTELRAEGVTLEEKCELSHFEYAAHGGCFPVMVKNVGMVGTITVSGLEQSQDHALVVRVLGEYLGK